MPSLTSIQPAGAGAAPMVDPTVLHQILARLENIENHLLQNLKSRYTVDEIAQMTGRSAYTVRRWIGEGRIIAERISGTGPRGKLLIPRSELAKLLNGGLGANVPDVAMAE